jgi:hypothetical protein
VGFVHLLPRRFAFPERANESGAPVQERQKWKAERREMQQELESLQNLVGLLLWQREEADSVGGGSDAGSEAPDFAGLHGLTSHAASAAPSAACSIAGTPRASLRHGAGVGCGSGALFSRAASLASSPGAAGATPRGAQAAEAAVPVSRAASGAPELSAADLFGNAA